MPIILTPTGRQTTTREQFPKHKDVELVHQRHYTDPLQLCVRGVLSGTRRQSHPCVEADNRVYLSGRGRRVDSGNRGRLAPDRRTSPTPGDRRRPRADAVIEYFNKLAQTMKASLAWDQGSETAQHTSASLATATPVFFADPHSPWQRPSNENANRLHQEYLPKGVPKSLRPRMPQQVVHGRRPRPHGASDRLAQPGDPGAAATRERLLLGDARCTHCIEGHPIPALTPELAGHGAWFDARRCLHGTVHGAQSGGQA